MRPLEQSGICLLGFVILSADPAFADGTREESLSRRFQEHVVSELTARRDGYLPVLRALRSRLRKASLRRCLGPDASHSSEAVRFAVDSLLPALLRNASRYDENERAGVSLIVANLDSRGIFSRYREEQAIDSGLSIDPAIVVDNLEPLDIWVLLQYLRPFPAEAVVPTPAKIRSGRSSLLAGQALAVR